MHMSLLPSNFSTPRGAAAQSAQADAMRDEEDFALGRECANPALQIESWPMEAAAQPLRQIY